MNRCQPLPSSRFLMAFALAWAFAASPALAQNPGRQFPPSALRGVLVVTAPPNVLINGTAERLSPGARIKGLDDGLILSGTLVGTSVLVNYRRDGYGLIHEVWILSAQEALQERKGMAPVTNFLFESDADKPKTDDGKTPYKQLPGYYRR